MNSIVKNTIILGLITCVAGALLGGVYTLTKDARAEQVEKSKQKAYEEVLPEAEDFKDITFIQSKLETKMKMDTSITNKEVIVEEVAKGLNKVGDTIGYVVTVTSKEGYGGDIQFSIGFDTEFKITTLSILSISETAGMGMKAQDAAFLDQFTDKNADSYEVVKDGADTGSEIDAISGATITSKAMVKAVNAATYTAKYVASIDNATSQTTTGGEN